MANKNAWDISNNKAKSKKNVAKNIDKSEGETQKRKMVRISENHHDKLKVQAAINRMGLQEYLEFLIDEKTQ